MKQNSDSLLYKKFKTIHEKYPKSDFAIASSYKIAQLSKDLTPNIAKENYIEYLSYAPNGKFALNSIDELSNLNSILNKDDYEIIADAKLANEQYKSALNYYQKTNFSKNWYKISKCYKGLNDNINEKEIIKKGLKLTTSEVEEKEISIAIDRLILLPNPKSDGYHRYHRDPGFHRHRRCPRCRHGHAGNGADLRRPAC